MIRILTIVLSGVHISVLEIYKIQADFDNNDLICMNSCLYLAVLMKKFDCVFDFWFRNTSFPPPVVLPP